MGNGKNNLPPALSAPGHPNIFYKKPFKASEHRPIPHRWYFVLTLHLAGKPIEEIAELASYEPSTIYAILAKPEVVQVRQQLLRCTQDEFEALFSKVVQVIKECLDSQDKRIALEAADKWFKAHGKYQPHSSGVNVTAEEVVFNILNQGREDD